MDFDYIIKYALCLYIIFGSFIEIPSTLPQVAHKFMTITLLITALLFIRYDFVVSILLCVCAIVYIGQLLNNSKVTKIVSTFTKHTPRQKNALTNPSTLLPFKKMSSNEMKMLSNDDDSNNNNNSSPDKIINKKDSTLTTNQDSLCARNIDHLQINDYTVEQESNEIPHVSPNKSMQTNVFDNLNYKLHYTETGDQFNIQGIEDHGVSGYDFTIYN